MGIIFSVFSCEVCSENDVREPPDTMAQSERYNIVIALHDFTATDASQLSFVKGERLEVIKADEPDWWYCRRIAVNSSSEGPENGFVPSAYMAATSLESEEWFFGRTSRVQAAQMLVAKDVQRGTYIVRSSDHHDGFTISIKNKGLTMKELVKHYKVKKYGGFYGLTSNRPFTTIQELLAYYSAGYHGICCTLSRPYSKAKPKFWPDRQTEIDPNQLEFLELLGTGNFGEVHLCLYQQNIKVAAKTLKPGTMSPKAFLDEAEVMRKCRHEKLVSLLGVCTISNKLCIVTEYMSKGSLEDYLRSDEGHLLLFEHLVDFVAQVASGMAYLGSRKVVHRDLAARNVLINENNVAKVADFGMVRVIEDDEYTATGTKFPVKWTAPEAIQYHKFSVKSDVWSYGVLLFETFSHGQKPYAGMSNHEVIEQTQRGYRMARPDDTDCTEDIYKKMLSCWDESPERRPTFEHLQEFFECLADTQSDGDSLYSDYEVGASNS